MNAFEIYIQSQNKKTICEQIVAQLTHLINSGRLQPGQQLPTVRDLARQLNINFNTVARAYRQLDYQRKITTQQGRGTYVLESIGLSEPGQMFSEADFLNDFQLFIQVESDRTGQSPEGLNQIVLHHLSPIIPPVSQPISGRLKYKKINRPGASKTHNKIHSPKKKQQRHRRCHQGPGRDNLPLP